MEVATFEELLTPRGRSVLDAAGALLETDDELAAGAGCDATIPPIWSPPRSARCCCGAER